MSLETITACITGSEHYSQNDHIMMSLETVTAYITGSEHYSQNDDSLTYHHKHSSIRRYCITRVTSVVGNFRHRWWLSSNPNWDG